MKGIHFRALMAFAEERFGQVTVELMLDGAALDRDGAYTNVGDYPFEEFDTLVSTLSRVSGAAPRQILRDCGRRTIAYVLERRAQPIIADAGMEATLASLQDLIRVDSLKLHGDAELPTLALVPGEAPWIVLELKSERPAADLAEGWILGTLEHLKIPTEILRQDLPPFDGRAARFRVRRVDR
ncbi:MAG: hypothetical protein Kilf2KO_03910 [Rhodospirillales bacterium]